MALYREGIGLYRQIVVEWCEGGDAELFDPEDVLPSKWLLFEGAVVGIHDFERTNFYQEVIISRPKENGEYVAQGKKGHPVM